MKIGIGIAIAGMWIGVGIACFATPDAVGGFPCAIAGTLFVVIFNNS